MGALKGASEKAKRCGRSSSFAIPRLALWAGVGIFVFAMALSCGDDYQGGPRGNPNPNDPHPLWVFAGNTWAKYDQNGHELRRFLSYKDAQAWRVNRSNGEIWGAAVGGGNIIHMIFDAEGRYKKTLSGFEYAHGLNFDTNAKVAWLIDEPSQSDELYIKKLNYSGETLLSKKAPEELKGPVKLEAYEQTGEFWVSNSSNMGGTEKAVLKFDKRGDLLFIRTEKQLRFFAAGDSYPIFLDQTDGGLWLDGDHEMVKLDGNGRVVRRLLINGYILTISRTTGDFVVYEKAKGYHYLNCYSKSGALRWQIEDTHGKYDACFSESDGSAWYCWRENPKKVFINKVSQTGAILLEGIPVKTTFSRMTVVNEPYPYR